MQRLPRIAAGEEPADLVLKGCAIAHPHSLEWEEGDIAVAKGVIVGIGPGYRGRRIYDLGGRVVAPGFIESHCHIESTMLLPRHFAEAVVPRGTTAVIADPHEIANVTGAAGVRFMAADAGAAPLDVRFMAPSCVPASPFETAREEMDAGELVGLLRDGVCHGLGEMMNFPGVVGGDEGVWAKLDAFDGVVKDGHAPGLGGRGLNAYALSGCSSDHESVTPGEAMEKLRRGIRVMLREGATEHNLADLLPLLLDEPGRSSECMLASDDLTARDLLERGHMDAKIPMAVEAGLPFLTALRLVTSTPADHFRLRDRGRITPGRRADLVVLDDVASCRVNEVFIGGELVARGGEARFSVDAPAEADLAPLRAQKPCRVTIPSEEALRVPCGGKTLRAIRLQPGQVVTGSEELEPAVADGAAVADPGRDLAKIVVVDRNSGSGRYAVGFVLGTGLQRGAVASSVAHDGHNYLAVGVDDGAICAALRRLHAENGGVVVCHGGETAAMPLPVAGLMSLGTAPEVARDLQAMEERARELGFAAEHPFMALGFLSLSVIPELKITDHGYVNLGEGGLVPLFV